MVGSDAPRGQDLPGSHNNSCHGTDGSRGLAGSGGASLELDIVERPHCIPKTALKIA